METPSTVNVPGLPFTQRKTALSSQPTLVELIARERIRSRIEKAIGRLIDALDIIDGDLDLEPSLGAPEISASCRAAVFTEADGWHHVQITQEDWAAGANDDREAVDEDGADIDRGELDNSDLEPSLGAAENVDQTRWSQGDRRDLEGDTHA